MRNNKNPIPHFWSSVLLSASLAGSLSAEVATLSATVTAERKTGELSTDPYTAKGNGTLVGDITDVVEVPPDTPAQYTESNTIFFVNFSSIPSATYNTASMTTRWAFGSAASSWANFDVYALGWAPTTDAADLPDSAILKNDDTPTGSDGTRIADNLYLTGSTGGGAGVRTFSSDKDEITPEDDALVNFLDSRPAGAAGTWAVFRINHDAPHGNDGTVAAAAFNGSGNTNTPKLQLDFTVLENLITEFSGTTSINAGESATFDLEVAADATRVFLTSVNSPAEVDVTGLVGGIGTFTTEALANDDIFTLSVEKGESLQTSVLAVGVRGEAASSRVTRLVADSANLSINEFSEIATWSSDAGDPVLIDLTYDDPENNPWTAPYFLDPLDGPVASLPPNGATAAEFYSSTLDSATNPLHLASEFTVAFNVWFDPGFTPENNTNNWAASTQILSNDGVAERDDWGIGMRADGRLVFGVGNPSTSVISAPEISLIDGQWHEIVAQWDASELRLYVDGEAVQVVSENIPTATRKDLGGAEIPLSVGRGQFDTDGLGGLQGAFREIRFYTEAFNESDVATVLNELDVSASTSGDFRVSSISTAGDQITLTWLSSPGETYSIQGGSNLSGFPDNLASDIPSQGSVTTTTVTNPNPSSPKYFLRVETP